LVADLPIFITAFADGLKKYFLIFGNIWISIKALALFDDFFWVMFLAQSPIKVASEGDAFFNKERTPGTVVISLRTSTNFFSISTGVILSFFLFTLFMLSGTFHEKGSKSDQE